MIKECVNPVWVIVGFVFGLTVMWFYFAIFNKRLENKKQEDGK